MKKRPKNTEQCTRRWFYTVNIKIVMMVKILYNKTMLTIGKKDEKKNECEIY